MGRWVGIVIESNGVDWLRAGEQRKLEMKIDPYWGGRGISTITRHTLKIEMNVLTMETKEHTRSVST